MEEIYLINSSNNPNSLFGSEIKNREFALVQHKHLTNWKCKLPDHNWKNCLTNEQVSQLVYYWNFPSNNSISLSESEIIEGK